MKNQIFKSVDTCCNCKHKTTPNGKNAYCGLSHKVIWNTLVCNLYEKILNEDSVELAEVCVHPYENVYQSDTECYCEICKTDLR